MKRSSLQTRQVIFYLIALGLFSLSVLGIASYRGMVTAELGDDVENVGTLRSYALLIYIDETDAIQSSAERDALTSMREQIQLLVSRYPQRSDELINAWKQYYINAIQRRLTRQNTQQIVDMTNAFSVEISKRAQAEARNGYWMLMYSALGLILLLVRGFTLVRELGRAEIELRDSERRFAILAEASLDGIALSENGIIADANTQFSRLLGYEPAEVIGRHLTDFAEAQDVERSNENIQNNREISYEVTCVRKDKSTFPVEITARTLQFPHRQMRLTVARDITARKRLEQDWQDINKSLAISNERWRTLATLDGLTGAYTRRALHLTMIREIRRASHSGLPFSVMILDIDGFKQYNDSIGHVAGDAVLRRVVELLRSNLRDVDVVARYGGDEFVIVLVDTGALEANAVIRRCYRAIEKETGFKRRITASIGALTCFVETETSTNKAFCLDLVEEILQRVDRALYQSKTKKLEHITIADNLRVNKQFVLTKTLNISHRADTQEEDVVDELLDDVVA